MSDGGLHLLSDQELEDRLRTLIDAVATARTRVEKASDQSNRSWAVVRGALLNFAGFILSVPTSGASMLLTLAGMLDWAQTVVADARHMNNLLELRHDHGALSARLAAVQAEDFRRHPRQ